MANLYCRFCAEPKSPDKLLNLQNDEKKYDEILSKLTFVNAVYVNVTTSDMLPKTVCLICYDNLNKAYEFLDSVKKAQDVLTSIFTAVDKSKCDLSDDERINVYDDFLDNDESPAIKLEEKSEETVGDGKVEVKCELKEEPDLEEHPNYDDTLNVQDILDAAMCTTPFTSNVTIYAKEISDLSKKVVKNWKDYPWMCSFCNIEFLNIDMLRSHCKVVHGKCSAFMCIDCKVGRNEDFARFIKHVRKHRKALRYVLYVRAIV